jgi:predicted helicase
MSNQIVDLLPSGGSQCFPLYTYNEDGTSRRDNITDWALEQFRTRYGDSKITKEDIFYYVYGLLHHPEYREKYADNLKRELPRIPFAAEFREFSEAGRQLADLHLNYETGMQHPHVEMQYNQDKPLDWRVEKMRVGKDKTTITVNDSLMYVGIPAEAFNYKLGNRSALEWVIDQYQVKEDKRSGIDSDPNNPDDPHYIAYLVGRVIRVSTETMGIIRGLPERFE